MIDFSLTAVFYSYQIRQNTIGAVGGHRIRRRRLAQNPPTPPMPEASTALHGPGVGLASVYIIRIITDSAVPLKNQIDQALSDN